MKELLKRIKADVILSAVLCIAIGVALFVWPGEVIGIFCKVLAAGIIIMGIVDMVSYFAAKMLHPFSGILGLLLLLVGIWIFLRPESVVSLIPIVIGVILAVHGLQDLKLAIEAKDHGYERWWSMLIIALISLTFGVLCIINAFGLVKFATKLIGIALVYDGISDLWVVNRTVHAAKAAKAEEEALEAEYKEVE